jgi:fibronectin-binding autotransporter adhesin
VFNRTCLVSGSGSIWNITSNLWLTGRRYSLVISNGAQVFNSSGYMGYQSLAVSSVTGIVVVVTGPDSVWSNRNDLYVGHLGQKNSLVISNSGRVFNGNGYLAYDSSSSNNSVRVTGGAIWQNDALHIGEQGPSNSVVVSGGSVLATNLVVGFGSTLCNNLVRLDSGNITVTNATGDATFEVRQGKLLFNGGTLQVDRFVMTNSCAQFIRTGGTLIYSTTVLTSNLDADADGMANGWEQAYGLDPLNAADAGADNDGDGFTNLQEFQAGTDPTNNSSTFKVLSLGSTNGDVLVTWQAGGGRTNVVQSATDLTVGYTNVSPNIILPGSGDVTTNYLDAGGATNGPSRFYKIRLVP